MTTAVLGIDPGYAKNKRTTGLGLLIIESTRLRWNSVNTATDSSWRLEDLRELVPRGTLLAGVAIDGPLVRDLETVHHYRSAEALLSRGLFQSRGKPGQTSSGIGQKLHQHATELAQLVIKLEREGHLTLAAAEHPDPVSRFAVLEAFPNAFLAVLLSDDDFPSHRPPRDKISDKYWEIAIENGRLQRLAETLSIGRDFDRQIGAIEDHDERAAFVSALAALCLAKTQYVAVGDPMCGDIILPDFDVWGGSPQAWGKNTLVNNIASVRRNRKRYPHHEDARILWNGRIWTPWAPDHR